MQRSPCQRTDRIKGGRQQKGVPMFINGIWIGKHAASDEHPVWTEQGVVRTRTVRRLEPDNRFN